APGYVESPFSQAYRPNGAEVLLPEEVVAVLDQVLDGSHRETYISIHPHHITFGNFAPNFVTDRAAPSSPAIAAMDAAAPTTPQPSPLATDRLADIVRATLRLPEDYPLD